MIKGTTVSSPRLLTSFSAQILSLTMAMTLPICPGTTGIRFGSADRSLLVIRIVQAVEWVNSLNSMT